MTKHCIITGFLLLMMPLALLAQDYKWEAPVNKVEKTGFYQIFLPPMLTAKLKPDFSDLRIYNDNQKEIPYLLIDERNTYHGGPRHFLDMQENQYRKRKAFTRILVENKNRELINNFCMLLAPELDEVWLKLSGSNDQKKWGIIKNDSPYLTYPYSSAFREVKMMDIPESDYRFYELRIYNNGMENITPESVYYYDMEIRDVGYVRIPKPEIEQEETKSGSVSVVSIRFNDHHYIDKLHFGIQGPDYYLRQAFINNEVPLAEKKFNLEYYEQINKRFEISSELEPVIHLTNYRANTLELAIENKDSEPLVIESVEAFQIKKYAVAKLEKGTRYSLFFGDEKIEEPVYDLKYFKDSINQDLPSAHIDHILAIRSERIQSRPLFNIPRAYLWIGTGLILLLLIGLSTRILADLRKESKAEESSGPA